MFTRIISGGQTGVDRAALDVALALGLPCGGWCPQGRRAQDGPPHPRYPLTENPRSGYPQRTQWDGRDSDGPLTLTRGQPAGGPAYTVEVAVRLRNPYLVVDLAAPPRPEDVHTWAREHGIQILNVAGPRASSMPGIYTQAAAFLRMLLG